MRRKPAAYFIYRGPIERGSRYRWCDGWSEDSADGNGLYPWITRREAQADARSRGMRAVFIRER